MKPRPRIDLVSPPMSGHLHPILGIGCQLSDHFDVRVISTTAAHSEISAAGLRGHVLMEGADAAIAAIVNPRHPVRSNPFRLHRQFTQNLDLLARFRSELLSLWKDAPPDLVIADFVVPVAGSAAQELGIRWWTSAPSPCALEALDGPPAYLGGLRARDGALWRARDAAGRAAIRAFKKTVHALHRSRLETLGFPSVYRDDGFEAIYSPECILALGLEEIEFPRRVSSAVQWVGPVMYTPPASAEAPAFVEGRRYVLVTTGTHLPWRRERMMNGVRVAARQHPEIEFHVSDGDRTTTRRDVDGNVRRFGFVSYERDLPRYDVVVHHGGAGVMYRTLAAGLPAVVIPADYDQFDNAARLEAAGVAAWATWEGLGHALNRVTIDARITTRCVQLQKRVREVADERRVAALVLRIFRVS